MNPKNGANIGQKLTSVNDHTLINYWIILVICLNYLYTLGSYIDSCPAVCSINYSANLQTLS